MTILDQHVVGYSPDDAVAVRIPHRHSAHRDAQTIIHSDTAVIKGTLVHHFIPGLISIDGEILDDNTHNVGALNDGEIRGDEGLTLKMKAFSKPLVELEA